MGSLYCSRCIAAFMVTISAGGLSGIIACCMIISFALLKSLVDHSRFEKKGQGMFDGESYYILHVYEYTG